MSVLVKGMKMPTGCDDCPLYGIDMRCNITYTPNYTDGRFVERLGNCPLVDVPAPRSRLIDADELQRQFERMANEEWNKNIAVSAASCFDDAAVIVEDAPTIIEAEE